MNDLDKQLKQGKNNFKGVYAFVDAYVTYY